MTKILFINTNCSWNKGSAAQVVSTYKVLKNVIPKAEFVLMSYCPELDRERAEAYGIKVVGYYDSEKVRNHRNGLISYILHLLMSLFRCNLWVMLFKVGLNVNRLIIHDKFLKEYYTADIVIDLSGDSFSDWGARSVVNAQGILIAILLKKPIVMYSQSIGPFKSGYSLFLAKFCLNRTKLIIVREEVTKAYLQQIGIKSYLTADCAFLLEPTSFENTSEILLKEGIYTNNNRPIIGISVSQLINELGDVKTSNENVIVLKQMVDYLAEKLNAQVVFVPHVIAPKEYLCDDRFAAEKIYKIVKNKSKITLIKNEYSPEELKGIIGQCDSFIGARMHANIAALSSYIPTIAIAWSHKYVGIMRALGQEKYVCDFKTMNFEELKSKIDDLWDNREKIREELKLKVKAQKDLAWYSGELVRDLLNSNNLDGKND